MCTPFFLHNCRGDSSVSDEGELLRKVEQDVNKRRKTESQKRGDQEVLEDSGPSSSKKRSRRIRPPTLGEDSDEKDVIVDLACKLFLALSLLFYRLLIEHKGVARSL